MAEIHELDVSYLSIAKEMETNCETLNNKEDGNHRESCSKY